ncbi:TolC family protein [Pseudomonas sp. LS1212]|uniref:TolC family protein n=1 Tax=Pseudomonas sp. LS1212 TaxID=2972478 RepID=UPI00215CF8DD|nr:TolC family protein [Pseudomonas sp. LS1212]UVJ43086.1 TolC family protein [Pseudomonas sp. LS1212]
MIVALAVSWSARLPAASGPTLTLEEALQTALANNPELAAAQWGIEIARGDRQQAGLVPNPELSWEAEDTRRNSRTTTLSISQAVELGGKRGARVELARRGQDVAQVELERQRNLLRANVIGAFSGAARAQERQQLAEQSQALAERGLSIAQGRIRAGKASPVEATRAQVQLSEVRLEVSRAHTQRANAYQQLAEVTGAPFAQFSRVESGIAVPERVPEAARLLGRIGDTADLRLAQLQVDQREASLGLERSQRIPDLRVSLGSQYSETDRERVNVVGLSMPVPLFNRNQGNILAAARRADQARDLRNAAELRLRTDVRQALDQWNTAQNEVTSFNQIILPAAQNAVDVATRGFEMGKFGFLDVLDAQRTLINARTQYLQAAAQVTDAWVQIERAFGDLSNTQ